MGTICRRSACVHACVRSFVRACVRVWEAAACLKGLDIAAGWLRGVDAGRAETITGPAGSAEEIRPPARSAALMVEPAPGAPAERGDRTRGKGVLQGAEEAMKVLLPRERGVGVGGRTDGRKGAFGLKGRDPRMGGEPLEREEEDPRKEKTRSEKCRRPEF